MYDTLHRRGGYLNMSEPVSIITMSEYVSGLIDSDGEVKCVIRHRSDRERDWEWSVLPTVCFTQKIAGVIEGDGSIALNVFKNKEMNLEHNLLPRISIQVKTRAAQEFEMFLCELDSHLNIRHNMQIMSKRHELFTWSYTGVKNVEPLLLAIEPFMIWKREETRLLLREIIPRMKDGKHLNREGLLEVMEYADKLSDLHGKNSPRKYTREYFKENLK